MSTEATSTETSQSSQGTQGQSQSAQGSGATQGTSQGSTATGTTETQTAQTQQQTAPSRPDWLPETFFDASKGPKWDDFGKHFNEIVTRDAAEQSRRLALPTKPEDVKIELPKDFVVPQGLEFKLDATMPEYSKLQAAAVKHGLSAEAVSDLVGVYAETLVGSEATISAAHQAEIAKLGANGPARVTALETFFTGLVGSDGAKQIKGMAVTAGLVQALEAVASKFASQGTASFSQAHREPGPSGQKVSDEVYAKMSDREKLDYAKQFPQSQFQAA
jgi:hypothetical protein